MQIRSKRDKSASPISILYLRGIPGLYRYEFGLAAAITAVRAGNVAIIPALAILTSYYSIA